jgi:hypothetical protein
MVGALLLVLTPYCPTALAQTNPVPLINNPLVPTSVAPGGSKFTLTVNGTGFVSGAVVKWNGAARTTTFVSSSQLTAAISAFDIANEGTASISVINPGPGAGASNTMFLEVSPPIPSFVFTTLPNIPVNFTGGMLTADFNNDGKMDLAGVDNLNSAVEISLGNGDGTFSSYQSYQVGNSGASLQVGLVAADFNKDGILDLAVTNTFDNTVSILLGNGDGTFLPATVAPTSPFPSLVIAADLNGDGNVDLGVLCPGGSSNGVISPPVVSVLLGNGNGTFSQHVDAPTGGTGIRAMAFGDLNLDGKLDLALTDANSGTLWILLGNNDGTFQAPRNAGSVPRIVSSMTSADVNGDGYLDLIMPWPEGEPGGVSVLLGNGEGTFSSPVNYLVGNGPTGIAVNDLNADGILDIVVANDDIIIPSPYNNLAILLGNGDGTFQSSLNYSIISSGNALPSGILVADFNGDGKLDMAIPLNDVGNVKIVLQGTFPVMSLSANESSFGDQLIGSNSSVQITLTDSGTAALTISSIAVSGTNSANFTESNNCGGIVAVGSNCTITISFVPTVPGALSASLLITSNAVGGAQTITLTGTALGPVANISPSSITFPSQIVGSSGLPQNITLANLGTAAIIITNVSVSATDFGVVNACGSTVSAGSSCTIGVFFDPTISGARAGTLTITDNSLDSPQTVTLAGTGQAFSLGPTSSSTATIAAGQTANYTLSVTPGGGFNQTITLTCSGAPALSVCQVSPSLASLNGTSSTPIAVVVTTTAPKQGFLLPFGFRFSNPENAPIVLIGLCLGTVAVISVVGWHRKQRFLRLRAIATAILLTASMYVSSCGGGGSPSGGGGSPGTPVGSYTITVSGTFASGSTTLNYVTKLTLIVQ